MDDSNLHTTTSKTSDSSSLSVGDKCSDKSENSENKENMDHNNQLDNDSSSAESLNLRIEETQNIVGDTAEDVKWSDKLNKSLDKDAKLKFNSSSSGSPSANKQALDQSVIIEDSPVRNISVIDISDSSFVGSRDDLHLVLEDTPKQKEVKDEEMSEILASNSLLYQDCDNLDNVIDNDEDVQSMKDSDCLLDFDQSKEVFSHLITSKTRQEAQSWSPKQKIWNGGNDKKRKAEAASLSSSEESCKKKLDSKLESKNVSKTTSDGSMLEAEDEKSVTTDVESRPCSSADIARPEISCSPIIAADIGDIHSDHNQLNSRTDLCSNSNKVTRNSTSTPVDKLKKTLSTPQKLIRKKQLLKSGQNERDSSEDDDEERVEKVRKPRAKADVSPGDETIFKEPSLLSETISFSVSEVKSLELPEVKQALEVLRAHGIVLKEKGLKKRLSDGSNFSSGGSSGYLGGSSSGSGVTSSSGRSRLSMAPETNVPTHNVIAPLPAARNSMIKETNDDHVEKIEDAIKTSEADSKVTEEAVNEESKVVNKHYVADVEVSVKTPGKRGRKKKEVDDKKDKSSKKVYTKRREKDTSSVKDEDESEMEEGSQPENDPYAVNTKVFARWKDGMGFCFYPAIIQETVGKDEVKVKFVEDRIVKKCRKETEVVIPSQMIPGNIVTVKHDVYSTYTVTAALMKYPVKTSSGTIEYEVQITATDSEPQSNEDSRVVSHDDITLTDDQGTEILRSSGLLSHRVSSKIDLGNVMFSKRKTRGVVTTPSSEVVRKERTPRRYKRGGDNCEESAATTTHDSSAPEVSPRKTPSHHVKTLDSKAQRRLLQTTDEEEIVDTEVKNTTGRRGERSKGALFSGLSFILTHSSEAPLPAPDAEESVSESEAETNTKSSEPRFDKKSLRAVIVANGGLVLDNVPTHTIHNVSTLDTTMVGVSDRHCKTMNYLLCLSQSIPLVSHVYILDCVRMKELLDKRAYLLPAGYSDLLIKEVEQAQDLKAELSVNGCLLPHPPATSTRQSARAKQDLDTTSGKKVLSGIHVLVLSTDKHFTEDWQSVLDSLGAAVTARHATNSRLATIRAPDVVVTDTSAPAPMCKDLLATDIPVVSTNWIIQCTINNARIAYNNFKCKLPST